MKPRQPADRGKVPNPDGCRARRRRTHPCPPLSLRCRVCETEHPLEAVGVCPRCFGPLDPVYDWDRVRARSRASGSRPGRRRSGATRDLLPVAPPAEPRLAPGLTPLVRAPRLAEELGVGELWLKLDTANPTHSFKDRVVAVAAREGAGARADDARLLLDRQPRRTPSPPARPPRAWRPPCSARPTSSPRSSRDRRLRGDDLRGRRHTTTTASRLTVELSFELPWGFVNVGLPLATTPRARRRSRYEIAEQLGWRAPDVVVDRRSPPGRCSTRSARASPSCWSSGSSTAPSPRHDRRPGRGLPARRDRVPRRSGRDAGAAQTRSPARSRSATPPTGTSRSRRRTTTGGAIHAVAEDAIGENMALLAETTGVFGETAAGVTLGALRAAVAAGEVGARRPRRPPRHGRRSQDARAGRAHLRPRPHRRRRGRLPRRGARPGPVTPSARVARRGRVSDVEECGVRHRRRVKGVEVNSVPIDPQDERDRHEAEPLLSGVFTQDSTTPPCVALVGRTARPPNRCRTPSPPSRARRAPGTCGRRCDHGVWRSCAFAMPLARPPSRPGSWRCSSASRARP